MKLRVQRRGASGAVIGAILLSAGARTVDAQWPQFGGPARDFTAPSARIADRWPESGPRRLWQRPLGDGYGTILVDGGALFVMYRVDQDEFVASLDRETGKTLWQHQNPSPTSEVMGEFGAGPSSTPILVGDRLYTIGTNMLLHCFEKHSGSVIWTQDLAASFGAEVPRRGYSASPVRYRDTLILPVGEESEGQCVAALSLADGSLRWKNPDFLVTHASPFLINFQGEAQLVLFMASELVGLDPGDGRLLWSHPHKTQYGANLSTPVFDGKDTLFCSAAYDSGARAIRLVRDGDATTTKELWYSRKMRLHHGNAIELDGVVYGSSGDFGPAFFMGVHLDSGEIAWRERGFKKATFVHGDGKVIILDEDGHLALAAISPEGLKVLSTCKITEPYSWAAPTLVGRNLYVRDRKVMMAFDVG